MTSRLEGWLAAKGFRLSESLGFRDYGDSGGGRGVVAVRAMKEGETEFVVPRDALLHQRSPHCRARKALRHLEDWPGLIAALMSETFLGAESWWDGYVGSLPERSPPTPLHWSTGDLEMLKGTQVMSALGLEEIEDVFEEHVRPVVEGNPKLFGGEADLGQYLRCGSLVMSRAFDSTVDGRPAMTPMADMLNHRTGLCNSHLSILEEGGGEEEGALDVMPMVTLRAIQPGEELINTYGDHGNAELLRRYGFTDPDNPFDSVEIPMGLLGDRAAMRRIKRAAARGAKLPTSGKHGFVLKVGTGVPKSLLRAAAVVVMSDEAFLSYCRAPRSVVSEADVTCTTLGAQGWLAIESAVRARLSEYPPGSLEDCRQQLSEAANEGDGVRQNLMNALRVRLGEQQILYGLLERARKHVAMPEREQDDPSASNDR